MSDSPARFLDLCLDAVDHQALADWWCAAMGYVRHRQDRPQEGPVLIADPAGKGPNIWLNPVPEGKTVKNRMHHDVTGDTTALLALGATLLRRKDDEVHWDVLADPEGNEFCVFAPD
jgi:Glyoxalase-like domain